MGNATDRSTWGARFYLQYVYGGLSNRPERWAWHAYRDGERTLSRSSSSWWAAFRAFAIRTSFVGDARRSPFIWLTEQGATRVRQGANTAITQDENGVSLPPAEVAERANLVTDRLTRAYDSGLLTASSRILRFYYYHVKGIRTDFDAGLLDENGTVRGNYYTYRCRVQAGPLESCP